VDAATGTFAWTPADGQAGIHRQVTFIVSDGTSSDTEEVAITCYQAAAALAAPSIFGTPTVVPSDEPLISTVEEPTEGLWEGDDWSEDLAADIEASSEEIESGDEMSAVSSTDADASYDDTNEDVVDEEYDDPYSDEDYIDEDYNPAHESLYDYIDDEYVDDIATGEEYTDNSPGEGYPDDTAADAEYLDDGSTSDDVSTDGEDVADDEIAEEEVDTAPGMTANAGLFYADGIGTAAAEMVDGDDATLPSWAPKAAGATMRVLLALPGFSGSTDQGTSWIAADPSQVQSTADGGFVVERPKVTAVIGTDGLSLENGTLRGRATAIEFEIQPVAAALPVGEVSSSCTFAAMTIPPPASQAVVALSAQPDRGMQAAFEKAAADEKAVFLSIAAVSTVTVDRVPGMATVRFSVPAEWVSMQGLETCRILYARSDGSHAAILPTSANESDGRVTFTATAFGDGTFALASVVGEDLPDLAIESRHSVVGAELFDSAASEGSAADVSVNPFQTDGLLWHLLISTGGSFIG
jgi:hypothetical protein